MNYRFLFIGLLFLAIILVFSPTYPSVKAQSPPPANIIYPKVYFLIFNPILENKNNLKLVDYANWNNPDTLAQSYIDSVRESSHDIINYQIAGRLEVDDIPLKADGFDYTDQSYLDCIEKNIGCHNGGSSDIANYNKIISDYQVCEKANSGEIDELWIMGGPWFGFYEANMAGPGGFWTNGPVIQGTSCQRPIHIMGFSYQVGYDMMLHDLGHRTEGTLDHFVGYERNETGYSWGDFRSNPFYTYGNNILGCGDTHYTPNSIGAYIYNSQNYNRSNCDDWLNYPNFTGISTDISCTSWNCNNTDYSQWWFTHIPHAQGVDSRGKYNNWWLYISNSMMNIPITTTITPFPTSTTGPTKIPTPSPVPDLNNGLVNYYPLDETGWINDCNINTVKNLGTIEDIRLNIGYGKSCPANLGPLGGVIGIYSYGGYFDGIDDHIRVDTSNIPSQNGTVSLWVYPENQITNTSDLISAGPGGNDFRLLVDWGNNSGLYGFFINGEYRAIASSVPQSNKWTHVALTWDQINGTKIFFDGLQVGGNPAPPPIFNVTSFDIGRNNSFSSGFKGIIDDVKIYNRSLTDYEVALLYSHIPETTPTPTITIYPTYVLNPSVTHTPTPTRSPTNTPPILPLACGITTCFYGDFECIDSSCSSCEIGLCQAAYPTSVPTLTPSYPTPSNQPTSTITPSQMPSVSPTAIPTPTVSSSFGNALSITDTSPGYINIPYRDYLSLPGDFTFETWVKYYQIQNDHWLLSQKFNYGQNPPFAFDMNNGKFGVHLYTTDAMYHGYTTNTTISEDRWYHFAVVKQGLSVKMYLDGILDKSFSLSVPTLKTLVGDLVVGSMVHNGQPFNFLDGVIDDFRLSSSARYQDNFTPPQSPLLPDDQTYALYHFDENSGATNVWDASSNANTGNINGTVNFIPSDIYQIIPTNTPTLPMYTPTPYPTVIPLAPRGIVGDSWGDIVIGQPDFNQAVPKEITNFKVAGPGGVVVDRTVRPNRVYIYDGINSRILGYSSLGVCQNNQSVGCSSDSDCAGSVCELQVGGEAGSKKADLIIGQPNNFSSACNGDGTYQSYPSYAKTASRLFCSIPQDTVSFFEYGSFASMTVDGQSNLFVADFFNNRVLKYKSPFATDTIADEVWGQDNMESNLCNKGNVYPDASSICFPHSTPNNPLTGGVEIDSNGNLWVADSNNNRVLRFPNIGGQIQKRANLVLGQSNFTSNSYGSSYDKLYTPSAVRVSSDGVVYVADSENNRVLKYSPPLTSGMYGQLFAGNFKKPTGIEFDIVTSDPTSGGIWVSDTNNNQLVLFEFDQTPKKTLFKDTYRPDGSCGNPGMECLGPNGKDTCNMCDARGSIGITSDGDIIAAASNFAQNANFYRHPIPTINPGHPYPAIAQLFSPPEGHNYLSDKGFLSPRAIAITSSQFIIGDAQRIMFWNTTNPQTLSSGAKADGVVGVPDFKTFADPHYSRLAVNNDSLWAIRGYNLERFSLPLRSGQMPDQIVPLHTLKTIDDNKFLVNRIIPNDIFLTSDNKFMYLALPYNDRVIRVQIPPDNSGTFYIDIIIGGQNIPPADTRWHRSCPSVPSLCAPGSITFDRLGNLYISNYHLENEGDGKFFRFSTDLFPQTNSNLLTYDTTNAAQTFTNVYGWQPTFDSQNRMVLGFAGFTGSSPMPLIYNDIIHQTGTHLVSDGKMNDFYSQAYASAFDNHDNLYLADLNRGRVLIYISPFSNNPPPSITPTYTPTSIPSLTPTPTEIIDFGNALSISTATPSGYINIPYKDYLSFPGDFTFETWVKYYQTQNDHWLLSQDFNYRQFPPFVFNMVNGKFGVHLYTTDAGYHSYLSNSTISADRWYHFAVVKQGLSVKMYIDGILDKSFLLSVPTLKTVIEDLTIGSMVDSGRPFNFLDGVIDDFRLSSSARYQDNFTPPQSPLLPDDQTYALYHFDENSGATNVWDASSNANTGNINGTVNFIPSDIVIPPTPIYTPTRAPAPTSTPSPTLPPVCGIASCLSSYDCVAQFGSSCALCFIGTCLGDFPTPMPSATTAPTATKTPTPTYVSTPTPTRRPTNTPVPTQPPACGVTSCDDDSQCLDLFGISCSRCNFGTCVAINPTPIPSVTTTPTPTQIPTPSSSPTSTPTIAPTITPSASLTFRYNFPQVIDIDDKEVTISFYQNDNLVSSMNIISTHQYANFFRGTVYNIPTGVYDITIKTDRHLSRRLQNINIVGGSNFIFYTKSLIPGDIDAGLGGRGNNIVDLLDYNRFLNDYSSPSASSLVSDLNYDGVVDIGDYSVLVNNFGQIGE